MQIKLRTIALTGMVLMIVGFVFGFCETIYFGSNYLPESKAELRCDGISMLITGAGCGLFSYAIIVKTMRDIKNLLNDKDNNGYS